MPRLIVPAPALSGSGPAASGGASRGSQHRRGDLSSDLVDGGTHGLKSIVAARAAQPPEDRARPATELVSPRVRYNGCNSAAGLRKPPPTTQNVRYPAAAGALRPRQQQLRVIPLMRQDPPGECPFPLAKRPGPQRPVRGTLDGSPIGTRASRPRSQNRSGCRPVGHGG